MCAATKSDYERVEVPAILAGVEQDCSTFSAVLDANAQDLAAAGDPLGAEVLSLLAVVCSYGMRPDNGREPFGPRAILGDRRTASIEDLQDAEVALLADVCDLITVPELRARVADVLFVRRRHHRFGKTALAAYLESADTLMTEQDWVKASFRFERALVIGMSVKSEQDRVVAKVMEEIEKRRGDPSYFSAKMMEALLEQRLGDAAVIGPLAEEAAQRGTADTDWDRAREYFLLLAQWSRRAGRTQEEAQARREAAECNVKLADRAGSRSLEASFLERAIHSLRTIAGTQAEVEVLHQRLVAAEKDAPKEFKEYSSSVNLGDAPEKARAHVSGVSLHEALARLACIWVSPPVSRVRDAVIETAKHAVLFNAIPRVLVNRQGKVIAKRGSLVVGDPESQEESLRGAMFERANQQRDYVVVSTIKPARAQLVEEHYVSFRSLLPFTAASAFVPAGREEVFALGLVAGFDGDFATALHVLMPQFENALRTILAANGTLTSKVDADGIQDERDLGWLLTCDDAKMVFGENLLFDMRGLLIERFGANLRNQMAHGLLDVDLMVGPASVYFWWLTLHLVVQPLLQRGHEDVPASDAAQSS
jgi:hypothetical protein